MISEIKKFLENPAEKKITLKKNLSILDEFLILPKDFSLEQEDKKLINKWNLLEVEKNKKLQDFLKSNEKKKQENYSNENLGSPQQTAHKTIEKKKICLTILEETLEVVKSNIQKIINQNENYHPSILKEFSSIRTKIDKILTTDEDSLIFYTNIFFNKNKLYELLIKNIIYVLILGNKLKVKQNLLEILFLSTLLSEVFYFTKNPKALNQEVNIKDLNFQFLKEHISFAYKKIKENYYISNSIKNIVLFHHEHLDGSGPLKLEKEKINSIIHILTITQEFFYLTSDFLENFFPRVSPYKATLFFLKNRKKYHEKCLNCFLSLNPLFPLGEIIILKNQQKAIVIEKSSNYKLPVVEIISEKNQHSIIDLSTIPEDGLIYSVLKDKLLKNKLIEEYKKKKKIP